MDPDAASDRASRAVRKIANIIGLVDVPAVYAGNVPNALASIYMGNRVIIYNPTFLNQIEHAAADKWVVYSVLAHELGHHLNGHTVSAGAADPNSSWLRELSADYYSGFALRKLGASLKDAQAAMRAMGALFGTQGSQSHPPIDRRLKKIAAGWKHAGRTPDEMADASQGDGNSEEDTGAPVNQSPIPAASHSVYLPGQQQAAVRVCCSQAGRCALPMGVVVGTPCYCTTMVPGRWFSAPGFACQ